MHEAPPRRLALFGVRPCELAAIHKQDRVLREGPHADPHYRSQRSDNVIIVVNCAAPAATCFCASTSTGPAATAGFDLAITELVIDEQEVAYVVEVGSTIGADLLASIEAEPATTRHLELARSVLEEAARSMTRRLDSDGAHDVLFAQLESSYWAEIAERCLMCGNCTSVCPTCFCTDLVDVTDLSGEVADRWQVWDSCFSLTFSQLGSEPHRLSGGSRYRQWLVHKLASWIDQYGESGCVGCGRCITWCPVGIDLTAEIEQLSIERSEV